MLLAMAYNDRREHLETRPDTTERQRDAGGAATRGTERAVFGGSVDRVRGGGPTVLGLAGSRGFLEARGT